MHVRYTVDCDVLPAFTAAYLRIANGECAFVEAHTAHAVPRLLAELDRRGRRPEDVRWVVVTHAHLDHAAGASALLAKCPNATLLAHPRAARHLIDPEKLVKSATAVYGAERFAKLYGTIDPIPETRVRALEDGETFELGGVSLRVWHTAGHAKHHFVIDDPATGTVYTGDTFGLVYPALQRGGARFAFPSTSPTDFDAPEARKSLEKVLSLGEPSACLTHFGEIRDLDVVAAQLRGWLDRSEAWVEAASRTDEPVATIEAEILTELRAAMETEARAVGLALDASDWKHLETDLTLNAQGLAFAADRKRTDRAKAAAAASGAPSGSGRPAP